MRFRPVEAAETPDAIEQLILAYMDARQDSDIPILLVIPCLVLDFLCIHPFSDGNGRVSRLLTIFLLYKHGYDIGRYISIEQQINRYREAYYEALEKSSLNWHSMRTVELVLGQLQKKGEIKKIGSFRDARYMRI